MTRAILIGLALLTTTTAAFAQDSAHVEREQARIRMHLSHVETILRARDTSQLTPAQQAARAEHLDALHAYWVEGRFPINEQRAEEYLPIFIDERQTACAVGHLMIEDGAGELAERLHQEENYAYVVDMQTEGLADWAAGSGFTVEELAMIQPSYCGPGFDAAPCGGTDAGTGDDDGGGCAVSPSSKGAGSGAGVLLAGLALMLAVRRR